MITKFILIIWIGYGQTQSIATVKFDSQAECQAAKSAIAAADRSLGYWMPDWPKCVPYTFAEPAND